MNINYKNVSLWFARDRDENIITINDINDENKAKNFFCPICGSDLKPRAIDSTKVAPHFVHVDASKCNSETMVHWWFKNKFIEQGDKFTIVTDEEKDYTCKTVNVEQPHKVESGNYQPDITVETECGETIYFEMNYSNKKNVKEYLDIWLELQNTVVEVDIKNLMRESEIPKLKARFYNGKCFNTKRNDTYYNTIGKYKEELSKTDIGKSIKSKVEKLDWFWDEVVSYRKGKKDIGYMTELFFHLETEERAVAKDILRKVQCTNIVRECISHRLNEFHENISNTVADKFGRQYANQIDKRSKCQESKLIDSRGFIRILSARKNSRWYEYDIEKFSVDQLLYKAKEFIKKNIQYEEKEKMLSEYLSNRDIIIDKIKNSEDIIRFKRFLTRQNKGQRRKYGLQFYSVDNIGGYYYDPRDLDYAFNPSILRMEFALGVNDDSDRYIDNESYTENYVIVDMDSENVHKYCKQIASRFKRYFDEMDSINNHEQLDSIKEKIERHYANFDLYMESEILEDKYILDFELLNTTFSYSHCYYITNKGILQGIQRDKLPSEREFLLKANDPIEIKEFIIKDIGRKMESGAFEHCSDCNISFGLTLGELRFYIEKKFHLPKRCKPCRNKRKKTRS